MLATSMTNWLSVNQLLLTIIGFLSLFIFFASILSLPWLVSKIPEDYFLKETSRFIFWRNQFPYIWPLIIIIKNVTGVLMLISGLVMLVTPGQGILTIFIGMIMLDYPKKSMIEKKIILNKSVLPKLNWLRRKVNKNPIINPDNRKN
tara:strand:+ start:235 stop:675 length:441 start_codon:yes stop_codon:yes gene_type:complete